MDQLLRYFPDLTEKQKQQFAQLQTCYAFWNEQINVISRTDMVNLYERHVLHSLAIAKFIRFVPGSRVLDLGTGGGFPGVPLAIMFPDVEFILVDGTGKKIKVVQEVIEAVQIENAKAEHIRAEELKMMGQFDFVVTRAVATSDKLLLWSQKLISSTQRNSYPNGLIALKGGNLKEELKLLPGKAKDYTESTPLSNYFSEPFFAEKCILYIQA
jgi:16S rRNA (guanine527-N7)-methyltransferase